LQHTLDLVADAGVAVWLERRKGQIATHFPGSMAPELAAQFAAEIERFDAEIKELLRD
jgi:hypothetical protein